MRMTRLFGSTVRENPAEAETASHQLLLRAGFIRPLGSGIFSLLPLGWRVMQKIEVIMREEMNGISGQELLMPIVHPADLWKQTGRWQTIGPELGRFTDRSGHDMVLAMTHEEVVADLTRAEIHSYKQLPQMIYHIQTKWRDDPRPRAGLIRTREFIMLDSYSMDSDRQGLEAQYRAHYQAYFNIFHHCGLDVMAIHSDPGMMGGSLAHEFMYLSPIGEDSILICDACGYAANRQLARFKKLPPEVEEPASVQKIHTPGCRSIEELANFLDIPKSRTAKAVFFTASIPQEKGSSQFQNTAPRHFIFAIVRGDMELSETKLTNALHATELTPATEEEIRLVGAVPGYASPIGLLEKKPVIPIITIIDDLVAASPNLVAGANEPDYHLFNTNTPRDYQAMIITDIAAACAGDPCPECGTSMRMERGVEVGNIFQLGTRYSDTLGCTFLDRQGKPSSIYMGSYGIGLGRLLACVAEACHDEDGLIWPVSIAPFQVHLILLPSRDSSIITEKASSLYSRLLENNIEVLFDDRDESPGVKFKDADLIGCPLRLTVSERTLAQGSVELKIRSQPGKILVPMDEVMARIDSLLAELRSDLLTRVVPVKYNG